MLIALKEMTAENRRILEQMFQYYLYDMSEFTGWSLSEDGSFSYPTDLLTPYWQEQDHYPYFITCNDEVAGFCLLRRLSGDRIIWDMGQFFVLRKFRRHKLGEMAFEKAISLHTGQWQVRVLIANKPASILEKKCRRCVQGEFRGNRRKLSWGEDDVFHLSQRTLIS